MVISQVTLVLYHIRLRFATGKFFICGWVIVITAGGTPRDDLLAGERRTAQFVRRRLGSALVIAALQQHQLRPVVQAVLGYIAGGIEHRAVLQVAQDRLALVEGQVLLGGLQNAHDLADHVAHAAGGGQLEVERRRDGGQGQLVD